MLEEAYRFALPVDADLQVAVKPHAGKVLIETDELEDGSPPQRLVGDSVLRDLDLAISLGRDWTSSRR